MTKEEIAEIKSYAEHFDGDLKKAAVAFLFGLGVIKLKGTKFLSLNDKKKVAKIAAEVGKAKD